MTPAEELNAAAFRVLNPWGNPVAIGIDEELRTPLAAWLEQTATLAEALPTITATNHALAVARAITGGKP